MKIEVIKSTQGYDNYKIFNELTKELKDYLFINGYRWSKYNQCYYPATAIAKEKNSLFTKDLLNNYGDKEHEQSSQSLLTKTTKDYFYYEGINAINDYLENRKIMQSLLDFTEEDLNESQEKLENLIKSLCNINNMEKNFDYNQINKQTEKDLQLFNNPNFNTPDVYVKLNKNAMNSLNKIINDFLQTKNINDFSTWFANFVENRVSKEEKIETQINTLQNNSNIPKIQESLFDKELIAYKNGEIDNSHIFNLGKPSEILQKCGFPERKIELSASRLNYKSNLQRYKFELTDILGLDKALKEPVAVFEYGDKTKAQNVIVNLQKDGKNFLAGIQFEQSKINEKITLSSIRTIFPKENIEWLNWINQGKMIYGNKEKLQALITQQRMNDADVNNQVVQSYPYEHCLESIDNIMSKFANVNDIFTENYPDYTKYKEHFELEHKLFTHYTNVGNIDARELSILETEEFFNAIDEKDTNKLVEFISDEELHECIDIFEDTLKLKLSNDDFTNLILKKIEIITELKNYSSNTLNNKRNLIEAYKFSFSEGAKYNEKSYIDDLVINYKYNDIEELKRIQFNYLLYKQAWKEYRNEQTQEKNNIDEGFINTADDNILPKNITNRIVSIINELPIEDSIKENYINVITYPEISAQKIINNYIPKLYDELNKANIKSNALNKYDFTSKILQDCGIKKIGYVGKDEKYYLETPRVWAVYWNEPNKEFTVKEIEKINQENNTQKLSLVIENSFINQPNPQHKITQEVQEPKITLNEQSAKDFYEKVNIALDSFQDEQKLDEVDKIINKVQNETLNLSKDFTTEQKSKLINILENLPNGKNEIYEGSSRTYINNIIDELKKEDINTSNDYLTLYLQTLAKHYIPSFYDKLDEKENEFKYQSKEDFIYDILKQCGIKDIYDNKNENIESLDKYFETLKQNNSVKTKLDFVKGKGSRLRANATDKVRFIRKEIYKNKLDNLITSKYEDKLKLIVDEISYNKNQEVADVVNNLKIDFENITKPDVDKLIFEIQQLNPSKKVEQNLFQESNQNKISEKNENIYEEILTKESTTQEEVLEPDYINTIDKNKTFEESKTLSEEKILEIVNSYPIPVPKQSIWGEIDFCHTIHNGIYDVSTSSHGGLMIEKNIAEKLLSKAALKEGYLEGEFYNYEEDSVINIAFFELIKNKTITEKNYPFPPNLTLDEILENTKKIIKSDYFPDYKASMENTFTELQNKEKTITNENELFIKKSQENEQEQKPNEKAQNWIIDKLKAAGIEVISDKDEFNRILESEKLLQKMSVDLSEIEALSKQLKEIKAKEEKNEKSTITNEWKKFIRFSNQAKKYLPIAKNNNELKEKSISVNEHLRLTVQQESGKSFVYLFSKDFTSLKINLNDKKAFEIIQNYYKDDLIKYLPNSEIAQQNLTKYLEESIRKELRKQNQTFEKYSKQINDNSESDSFINSMNALTKVLKTGKENITFNKTLREVGFRIGDKDTALSHIIFRRINEKILRTENPLSFEEAQKEVAAILILLRESVTKSEATLKPTGNWETELNGIRAVITQDSEGKYVLTGFNDNGKIEEATDAIKAGIAKYSYAPEFLDMYTQVGAVYSSITNIQQFLNKSSSQNMTLQDGTTYGFTHERKIYLNPDVINSATPIHEYTHLWDNYIQNTNSELWNKGKEAFKDTVIWNEVINDPHYADIADNDDLVLSECHARITGKVAEKVLERIARENGEIKKNEIIDWDKETWQYITENFTEQDIKQFESIKEFIETPMKDLMEGKNITIFENLSKNNDKISLTNNKTSSNIIEENFANNNDDLEENNERKHNERSKEFKRNIPSSSSRNVGRTTTEDGREYLQQTTLGQQPREYESSIEQSGNGLVLPVLTKKQMRNVREEVKSIIENKKDGEQWTSSELALFRQYEGGGGLHEKNATSDEVLNAFYTPYQIINSVWKLTDSYAPNAVTVLEPTSGIGRFADNRPYNDFTLREIDKTSSTIAKALHPDATVIQGAFQNQFFDETGRVKLTNYECPKYDIVIGNPPYGNYQNEWSGRGEGEYHTRYDQYFIEKALDSLKDENSILAFVIPSGTLNSGVNEGKTAISNKGVLIDAYRLPNKAFPTTEVGTDIVIFKKGAMDVNHLCNNYFFKNHPDKVLGKITTHTNQFGKEEEYITIPENQTLETLLTKIDQDIKNRGIDLDLILENQAKQNLEKLAETNKDEIENHTQKEKSNIEKMFDKITENPNKIVDSFNNCLTDNDKKSNTITLKKSVLDYVADYTRRDLPIEHYYDIETKQSFIIFSDWKNGKAINFLLGTINKNGEFISSYSEEEFKSLTKTKQEKLEYFIQTYSNTSILLQEHLLGYHNGNYYLKSEDMYKILHRTWNERTYFYDSKNKEFYSKIDSTQIFIPAIDFEKNQLENFSYSELVSLESKMRGNEYGYNRYYGNKLYYPTFESLYPENGQVDFSSIIDKYNSDRIIIEDEFNFNLEYKSYEEHEAIKKKWKEQLTSLVFKDSKIKTAEEFTQRAKEIELKKKDERENQKELSKKEDNLNAEVETRLGGLFSKINSLCDFSMPYQEISIDGVLVELRQDKENPNRINFYLDQKRKCSILFKEENNNQTSIVLSSYNNERLPLSFIELLYKNYKGQMTVNDISPFEEKVLSIDDLIKENQTKKPSKDLIQISNIALIELLKIENLEGENVLTSDDKHTAKINQKGTIKQVFFDKSNYASLEYNSITQHLTITNEIYNLGLQDVIYEKAKELNPTVSITRDFVIDKTRYIDTDGKTRIAAPKRQRYNPENEDLMTNKDFANLYGSSWREEERIFFEASGDFGNYVNLSRLTTEQINQLKNSKNYVEQYPNKFIHKEFFASGNIYKKLETLDKEFTEGKVPLELYEKNKKILENVIPPLITDTDISVLSSTIKDFEIDGINIKDKFLTWVTGSDVEDSGNAPNYISDFSCANVKREEIPPTIDWGEVYNYIQGIDLKLSASKDIDKKDARQVETQMKNDRKLVAENLFARFIKQGLNENEKTIFWKHYNKLNNAVKSPDWSKLPLYIDGMNKFRKNTKFKLYDQQIKGISFLCNKGNGLLAYDVGVGKTAAGIVATVNQIQTGKAKRPLIVVPKTVISQWESDIHELFPNIQVNNLDNLSENNTTEFYDGKHGLNIPANSITLVTKEALNNISFKEETRNTMLKDFQDLTGMSEEQFVSMSDRDKETYKNKLEEMFGTVEKIQDNKFIFWENCGFDNITVDEAHYYKNLFKVPRTNQSNEFQGMGSGNPSKRALKMFVMTQLIQKENKGKNVFLLTATPFTNSPSEIYSILTYIARDEMQQQGVKNFYDFCAKHIKTQYEPVIKANGNIEYSNVIKSFNELDGLQNILNQFIDKVDGEEAGIVRPNKHTLLAKMEATPVQREIFDFCTNVLMEYDPAEDIEHKDDEEYLKKHSGMILEAINIMRTACLSPALVNAEKLVDPYTEKHSGIIIPEIDELVESSPKLKLVCDTVVKNWKENKTQGQLIFMPQGTKYYDQVIKYIEKQGVPKEVFATIDGGKATIGGKNVSITKDDDEDEQIRTKVANKFNDIECPVKILIGSDAIKEGINLNGNSIALYNCMLGWNPTDAIQAEGRIWRQGNKQGDVNIVYPLIYNSVDSLMYQKYDEKKSRIDSLFEKQTDNQKIDISEINPADLKYELIKDPFKRARIEIDTQKQEVKKELLNIQNSVLNFDSYVEKNKQLNETLKNRIEGKNEYIANYNQKVMLGENTRSEEEQKKGVEKRQKAIEKVKKDIQNIQKKINDELNKEGKTYSPETFHEAKEKETETLNEKIKYLDSEEYATPIVEKYKKLLAEEANFTLSEEEKNPLDRRIQANLRPAYFTEWERKNERFDYIIENENNNLAQLENSIEKDDAEINDVKRKINHYLKEKEKFVKDWITDYGEYDKVLEDWHKNHIEIIPNKKDSVVKTKEVEKQTKIIQEKSISTQIENKDDVVAQLTKKYTQCEQGSLFTEDDYALVESKTDSQNKNITTEEKQNFINKIIDLRNDKTLEEIEFDFKGKKNFSLDFLRIYNFVPPFKVLEDKNTVQVMGENKQEFYMSKNQLAHLVDNGFYYARNKENLDLVEISKKIPTNRKEFLNLSLKNIMQDRNSISQEMKQNSFNKTQNIDSSTYNSKKNNEISWK